MEIVLAVFLLFGGFTLGSVSVDKSDDEPQSAMAMANRDGVTDSRQHAQTTHQSKPSQCDSDGAVIYRDLTVPYHGQIERPAMEISDCGEGCTDE